jgi:hypothetical protein
MDFANSNKALKRMTEYFAEQMRINLGAKVKRKSYRSKWKNGKPYNIIVKSFRGSHSATGNLINSIRVIKSNIGYAVTMADYGKYVNGGRRKGKGIPVATMNRWVRQKNFKPRNLKTGAFIQNTASATKTTGFLMNRKIKNFGIEAYPFIKMSRETTMYVFKEEFKRETKKDIINNLGIKFKIKK